MVFLLPSGIVVDLIACEVWDDIGDPLTLYDQITSIYLLDA